MTDAEVYATCWKGFWAKNVVDQKVWEKVDAIVWSWRPRKQGPYGRVKIREKDALKAQACLHLSSVHDHDGDEIEDVFGEE